MSRLFVVSPIGLKGVSPRCSPEFDSLVDKQVYNGISELDIESAENANSSKSLQALYLEVEQRYLRYSQILAERLNIIHGTSYSKEFWSRAYSLGLVRLITLLHQAFHRFEKRVGEQDLLFQVIDSSEYFVPTTFESQRAIFTATAVGREQLFSIYSHLFEPALARSVLKVYESDRRAALKHQNFTTNPSLTKDPKGVVVGIMGSYFSGAYLNQLILKGQGKIMPMDIPGYVVGAETNWVVRKNLLEPLNSFDRFDQYFFNSLTYLLPRILLEDFKGAVTAAKARLDNLAQLKYLVSEAWLGHSGLNIFRAVAHELYGIQTLYNEHNAIFFPFISNPTGVIGSLVDKYLTMGWESKDEKFVSTASLFPFKIPVKETRNYDALYVSYPMTENMTMYSPIYATSGYSAFKHFKFVRRFLQLIPEDVLRKIHYRGYPKDYNIVASRFDKESLITSFGSKMKVVHSSKLSGPSCKEQMAQSKLVVIDSLSTAYLEALQMNVPSICFWNSSVMVLSTEFEGFFDELLEARIMHTSPEDAASHFLNVFSEPAQWWESQKVQALRTSWLRKHMGKPEKLINYLLQISDNLKA